MWLSSQRTMEGTFNIFSNAAVLVPKKPAIAPKIG